MPLLDLAGMLGVPELPEYLGRVEEEMKRVVAVDNDYLAGPLGRLVKAGGSKRLRPALVIAAAVSYGKPVDAVVISGAVAIELVHLATWVHDDVIDNADSRHNVPTVNQQEGPAAAIVVGDFLLARACQQAATISAEAATLIAATMATLCDGQARELADQHNLERTVDSYLKAVNGKTASLMAAACQMGGLCAGLPQPVVKSLTNYGQNFGMAFQILDDVLDLTATPALLGKPTGQDVPAGIYTLPVLLALAGPDRQKIKKLLNEPDHPALTQLLLKNGFIEKTLQKAQTYAQAAADSLQQKTALQNLPPAYLKWSLRNFTY